MKKIGALLLAIMMIAVVGLAYATDADDTYTGSGNDNADNFAGLDATPQTIPITKGIVFFNVNGSDVYEPNVTFSYEVAPDTAVAEDGSTATVTDDGSLNNNIPVVRNVYPGPAGGVDGTSISFAANTTNGTHTAAAAGTEVEKTANLTLDISKFKRPGIYRYIITESVTSPSAGANDSAKLQAAGLTARDANYDNTRYLDVYIRNGSSGLEMYGAVIFKTTKASGDEGKDSITTTTKKTTGFEPNPTGDDSITYANDPNVDKYYTYDFTVKKTVSGSMADKNHEFPFYVTVSNSISGAMFTYTADNAESFTSANNASGAVTLSAANFSIGSDALTSNLTLKNNDFIKLVGLPSSQATELAVVVKEFNDTYDQYTASVSAVSTNQPSIAKTNDADGSSGVMNASTGSVETASFAVKTNDVESQILTIDNNLTEISPTGVVLRIAPYALMLAAGIFLLLLSRKRKNNSEEA